MKPTAMEGIYQATGRGFGFVTPDGAEGREDDLFIPPRKDGGAWHGDRVRVTLLPQAGEEGRPAGRVTAVLRRNSPTVIGRLEREGRAFWLRPDGGRLPDLQLTGGREGLTPGHRAEVKVLSYGGQSAPPLGRFVRSFGPANTRQSAVEAILARQGIPQTFPREVELAAGQAPQQVEAGELAGRLDLREEQIITIDGPASKDLDDAVSLTRDGEGRWLLGVHIADVSHYVPQDSPLDREAWERGTSVYFADRVIPMLPQALSNGICSLNPGVDRLTLSCQMTLDSQGQVVDYHIVRSVIRTVHRMNYPDCNALLAGSDDALARRYASILPMLREMEGLARLLRRRRKNRGALELDAPERQILCDGAGFPVDIQARVPGVSEGIIEEFMLIANETVARHLCAHALPGVFRVHEKPLASRLDRLRAMLAPFGLTLDTPDAFGLQKLLEQTRDRPEQPAVSMLVLRCLMKARYAPENLGHFGLGAEFYCHFTSPIRRYPDLAVHRALSAALTGAPERVMARLAADAPAAARQASQREEAAETAERDIEKCYQAEYMQSHLGEEYPGTVSGVTRFGLFVLLPNGAEGLVPLAALPEDSYDFDEGALTLTGLRTGRRFALACPLSVRCVAADPGSGEITLALSGAPLPPPPAESETRRRKGRKKPAGRRPMHLPAKKRRRR